eukprot:74439-Amphidinium_carterae.2
MFKNVNYDGCGKDLVRRINASRACPGKNVFIVVAQEKMVFIIVRTVLVARAVVVNALPIAVSLLVSSSVSPLECPHERIVCDLLTLLTSLDL